MKTSKKLVEAIKTYILEDENKEETVHELKRYKENFPEQPEYNWYYYGNILPYYSQIRDFYNKNGFIPSDDNDVLLEDFNRHLKMAIDEILEW